MWKMAVAPLWLAPFGGASEPVSLLPVHPAAVAAADLTGDQVPEVIVFGMKPWFSNESLWLVDGSNGEPIEPLDLGLEVGRGRTPLRSSFDADGDGVFDLAILTPGESSDRLVVVSLKTRSVILEWRLPHPTYKRWWPEISGVEFSGRSADFSVTLRDQLWREEQLYMTCPTFAAGTIAEFPVMQRMERRSELHGLHLRGSIEVLSDEGLALWALSFDPRTDAMRLRGHWLQAGKSYELTNDDCDPGVESEPYGAKLWPCGDFDGDQTRDFILANYSPWSHASGFQIRSGATGSLLQWIPMAREALREGEDFGEADGSAFVSCESDLDRDGVIDLVAVVYTHGGGIYRSAQGEIRSFEEGVVAYSGATGQVLWALPEWKLIR